MKCQGIEDGVPHDLFRFANLLASFVEIDQIARRDAVSPARDRRDDNTLIWMMNDVIDQFVRGEGDSSRWFLQTPRFLKTMKHYHAMPRLVNPDLR